MPKIKRVRTIEGVRRYGLPKDAIIVADTDKVSLKHKKSKVLARLARSQSDDGGGGIVPKQIPKRGPSQEKNPYRPHPDKVIGGEIAGPERITNAEYNEHTKFIESSLKANEHRSTEKVHAKKDAQGNNVWSTERSAIHKQIIDKLWEKKNAENVPNEGKAMISGGLGGAGKGTVLGGHADVDQSKYITVDPDAVKEVMAEMGLIPHVEGLSPMETVALIHDESSDIAMDLAKRAYAERKNIIWDITMSSGKSVVTRLNQLKENGYTQIDGVFVDITVEEAVNRALGRHRGGLDRHRDGKGYGGRYVPPWVIRENKPSDPAFNSNNRMIFDSIRDQFSNWGVWNNMGKKPVLVEGKGRWAAKK